ncbi:transposase [Alkalimarinus alittae]|uniref:Transposase n=1 Tax=Alkalimarinus alittae TaxID=2961619 RepID=A0ABY6N5G4_9ALTE|nr:transposase [Alkalimarinus alittae]UZE97219.1 transposase [Alkalimarinus alittae]
MLIDEMNLDQLLELNEMICARIEEVRAQQDLDALKNLRLGQQVHFDSQKGPIFGTVIKMNRKTIIVQTEGGRQWKIPAGIAAPIKDLG